MHLTDILTLCFSIVGLYGLIFHVRFLVPCYCVPSVSALLYDTQRLLTHAETLNAIPGASEIRMDLEILVSQLARIRTKSHRSPRILEQLWLALRHGLTCKLYTISSRIDALRLKVELAVDQQRLASLPIPQSAFNAQLPTPIDDVAIPMENATPPTLPSPV